MQRLDPAKRSQILTAAARLFAAKPFHEVKLDELAAAARIGKGTLYIYFSDKEDLYVSSIHDALCRLVDQLQSELAAGSDGAAGELALVVNKLVEFAYGFPDMFELLRGGAHLPDTRLLEKRIELARIVEGVLRRGVRRGEIDDPHPELSAQYVLAFLRVAMLHRPAGTSAKTMRTHMLSVLGNGLFSTRRRKHEAAPRKSRSGR